MSSGQGSKKKSHSLTGMDRVFFTNSGTEAIEGAIKLVRKYAIIKMDAQIMKLLP